MLHVEFLFADVLDYTSDNLPYLSKIQGQDKAFLNKGQYVFLGLQLLLLQVCKIIAIADAFVTSAAFRYLVAVVRAKVYNCNYLYICRNFSYGKKKWVRHFFSVLCK